jgi:hypothetical protein
MLNRLMLFASVMFGAALVAPSAALAQFGPPPGPPLAFAGPLPVSALVARLPAWAPVVLFLVVVLRAHLRAISQVLHLISRVSTALPDRAVSIAAVRPISVASRVASRPRARTTRETVTSAMATAVVTGTGPMRRLQLRLRLMPMADPTPPLRRTAITCRHTGETATTGAYCAVAETNSDAISLAPWSSTGALSFLT